MNRLQKIGAGYLFALLFFSYGLGVGYYKLFPYQHIDAGLREVEAFIRGDDLEVNRNLIKKIENDAGLTPSRFIYPTPPAAAEGATARFVPGLRDRRDKPLVGIVPEHREGYRVIVGALDFQDSLWGAILLSGDGEVLHTWALSTDHLPGSMVPGELKNLYGVHLFPDGSIIFSMHEAGGGIIKVDACGNELWALAGSYHHAVSPDGQGHFWTFIGTQSAFDQDMARVNASTGQIDRIIRMARVREANPTLHIWQLANPGWKGLEKSMKKGNFTHGNDIDPLSEELAGMFPGFEAGDLLVSYATTNLLFILDPETLKVKWWRVGTGDSLHDPDWEEDGSVVLFNNIRRDEDRPSNIVKVDLASYQHHIEYDGAKHQFRSIINGRHQRTDYGTRYITSSTQGWAFEVDDSGEIVSSFVNTYDQENMRSLHLSEAWRFSPDYFESDFWNACSGKDSGT